MNPFTRPQAGAYKPYLVEALNKVGRTTEAKEFANGNMKLAILSSVTGNVRLFSELNEVCANALNQLDTIDENVRYYFWGLSNGQFGVASSNGAYVYDPNDVVATAYVKARLESEAVDKVNPYFTS